MLGARCIPAVAALLIAGVPQFVQAAKDDPKWLMRVVQDGATLENLIADYIQTEYGVEAERRASPTDNADILLSYTLAPDDAPEIPCVVDTAVSAREHGRVVERVVQVVAWYELPASLKTPQTRARILELNNEWHRENWMPGRIYLDADGDIRLESFLNIPAEGVPVHPDLVYDLLVRTKTAWREYYRKLRQTLTATP
jgi:hypothetical protein